MSVATPLDSQPTSGVLHDAVDPDTWTLPNRLRHFAETRPDDPALREKLFGVWQEISWTQYYERTAEVARMLAHVGVAPGDHVAILSDNRPEWLYADLAAQGLGARAVGIYQTNPPEDVAYILKHCEAKVVFVEDQEQVDKVLEVMGELPSLHHIVVFDPRGTRHYSVSKLTKFSEFVAKGRELMGSESDWFSERLDERDPSEVTMIVYTSGTTGPPKGAMLSASNALPTAGAIMETLEIGPDDTILSYLPLCHVAEKIFTFFMPLTRGLTVHFGESVYTVQEDLREVSPTVFLGVPRIWEKVHARVTLKMKDSTWLKRTLYELFLGVGMKIGAKRRRNEMGPVDWAMYFVGWLLVFRTLRERLGLARCRHAVTGAAPISPELIEWFHAIGVMIREGYGQTECAGVSHINYPSDIRLGTVGQLLPGVEMRLAEDGEILLRGGPVFEGYLHNEEATKSTVSEDGWLSTGDIGTEDEDGFLRITGRKKEIIITAGGKNLSPEKIENVLKLSPYIKEAVAIGDQRKFIAALIQIDADSVGDWASRRDIAYTSFKDLTEKEQVRKLIADEVKRLNDHLAQVETVRNFAFFPKELHQDDGEVTATQKVRRRAVQEIYADLIESMYTKKKKS